jgi:hypothetical protein
MRCIRLGRHHGWRPQTVRQPDAISQQWAVSDWRRDDSNHGVLRTGGADIAFLEIGMSMLLPLTDCRWRVPLLGPAPTLSSSTMTGRWL